MSLPWDEPGWLDRATDWIDERSSGPARSSSNADVVVGAGARPDGGRRPLVQGEPGGTALEPALTGLLAARRADAVPEVVAAEGPRMLTRHIGPQLREVLDSGGSEPGVVHQEAHEGNVFVQGGRSVFLDWAEASVSHPFTGPLLALRSATECASAASPTDRSRSAAPRRAA